MGDVRNAATAGANFGGTSKAGTIPDALVPSEGPVYLEGRLVLSLSFVGGGEAACIPAGEEPVERLRLWDDVSGGWHGRGLEVLRYEMVDVVLRDGVPVWSGALDTCAPAVLVPDLDDEGLEANLACDLRWRRVGSATGTESPLRRHFHPIPLAAQTQCLCR